VKTVLLGEIIAAGSSIVVATHSASSTVVEVTASEYSASAHGIVAEKMDTSGAAPAMVPAVGSSTGVRRTG
jgi:hypothetical protein